jgi:hypothetical protein
MDSRQLAREAEANDAVDPWRFRGVHCTHNVARQARRLGARVLFIAYSRSVTDMTRFISRSFVVLLCAAACNWGTRPTDLASAMGPEGARVAVRVRGESSDRVGELYAVDTIGVIVRGSRLTRVSWPRLEAMDVDHAGSDYDVSFGESITAAKRARIAPLCRFPQGLSGDLLRSVLSALSQTALEEVR